MNYMYMYSVSHLQQFGVKHLGVSSFRVVVKFKVKVTQLVQIDHVQLLTFDLFVKILVTQNRKKKEITSPQIMHSSD